MTAFLVSSEGSSVHHSSCGQQRDHRWASERRNEVFWPKREVYRLVRSLHQRGTFLEVRRVNTHPSQKETQEMPLFERFVADSNEKEDE